jgi:DNA-binding NarL/FixJ family response regulator
MSKQRRSNRAVEFQFAGRSFVVVSLDGDPSGGAASLTVAEREVAAEVLCGRSNAEIARARATSTRTVAKQVAAVFRKLGVGSRAELALRLSVGK